MKVGAEEKEGRLMRALQSVYNPLSDLALRHSKWAVAFFFLPIVLCVVLFPMLGREFMPQLEEGNFWIRFTLPMSISMEQSVKYTTPLRAIMRSHPEIEGVISQVGRPDDGTDVTGFYNIELYAPLKPFDEWPKGLTKAKLTEVLREQMTAALPGADINFSQYISDNVQEAVAGVKGENSVKVAGPDLKVNETKAQEIVDALSSVRGITDLGLLRTLGQPSVKIVADRAACARYGLNSGDIGEIVDAAIGGHVVTNVFEGEKLFALTVRWQEPYRRSLDEVRQITVATPDGTQIALGQLATISKVDGPAITYREDGWRFTPVKFSVRGRDLAGAVGEAQQVVAQKVKLPYDTHLEWAGEINEMHQAEGRLMLIIPLTLLLITFLTFSAVKNWLDTIIVLINIPAACTGGIIALVIARQNLSVSAAMGFISIFGIAIQDAILVVTYFQRLRRDGRTLEQAAREGAERRFRPALMTTLVATLGLLPAALSNGIGSQTQKPLAIVVIGGSLILALTTRVLRPPLLLVAHRWFDARNERKKALGGPALEES
jgi:cobalt-zinc-cadmium resistance protein CzcA